MRYAMPTDEFVAEIRYIRTRSDFVRALEDAKRSLESMVIIHEGSSFQVTLGGKSWAAENCFYKDTYDTLYCLSDSTKRKKAPTYPQYVEKRYTASLQKLRNRVARGPKKFWEARR